MRANRPLPVPPAGIALLAALTLLWGSNWPAMKLALRELGPWTFRSACLVTGGLGLLAIAWAGGHRLTIPRADRWPLVAAALFNITGWHIFSAYGLTFIEAGRAAIIAYTMPLWAVLLGRVVLRESLTAGRITALALGAAGLAILIGPEARVLWTTPVGALLMLCAAASWAAGTVLTKKCRWAMPTVLLTGWQVSVGGVPVVVGQLLFERVPPLADLSATGLLATAYAAVVGIIVCHYAWFRVVALLPSGIAAIGTLGIPVVGVLSSGVLLREPVGARELGALVLVLPALAIVLLGPGLSARR